MFTDIVGSTALAASDGDEALRGAVATHESVVTAAAEAHSYGFKKSTGDGWLLTFDRVEDAIRAALNISDEHEGGEFGVRLALHVGDVAYEHGDISGLAVNLAARLLASDEAQVGGGWASGSVAVASTVVEVTFVSKGKIEAKGFSSRVPIFRMIRGEGDELFSWSAWEFPDDDAWGPYHVSQLVRDYEHSIANWDEMLKLNAINGEPFAAFFHEVYGVELELSWRELNWGEEVVKKELERLPEPRDGFALAERHGIWFHPIPHDLLAAAMNVTPEALSEMLKAATAMLRERRTDVTERLERFRDPFP